MKQIIVTILLLFFYSFSFSQDFNMDASLDKRVALVIGNSSYTSSPLANPVNDARAMADALRKADFMVMHYENVPTVIEMKKIVRQYGKQIENGGVGLVYYAGHGVQSNGVNYLIPVKAEIHNEEEIEYEALDVGFVMAQMEHARNRMNVIILDACRNNPYARSFRSGTQGLATINAPTGTMIAYATAPGSVASDGSGQNGLYTEELLKQISKPGLKIEEVFKYVRGNVVQKSSGMQTPWESSSLIGDFYFYPSSGQNNQYTTTSNTVSSNNTSNANKMSNNSLVNDPYSKQNVSKVQFDETKSGISDVYTQKANNVDLNSGTYWKGQNDTYWLYVKGNQIASETVNAISNDDLLVYHGKSNNTYLLEDFYLNQDNLYRKPRKLGSENAALWRSKDLFYNLYYRGKNIANETINAAAGNHLIVYHPTTNTSFLFRNFYQLQDDDFRNAEVLHSSDNCFWSANQEGYSLFVKAKNIAAETQSKYHGDHLQVYHPKSQNLYLLKNYQANADDDLREAEVIYSPGLITWSRDNETYGMYKDGELYFKPSNNCWVGDNLMVHETKTNMTFLLEDYYNINDDKQRVAKIVYSHDDAFYAKTADKYSLFVKGVDITAKTKSEKITGNDLKVTNTETGKTYLLMNYKVINNKTLHQAILDQ